MKLSEVIKRLQAIQTILNGDIPVKVHDGLDPSDLDRVSKVSLMGPLDKMEVWIES